MKTYATYDDVLEEGEAWGRYHREGSRMKWSLNWRASHAWLRGYSDAQAGKPQLAPEKLPFPVEDAEPHYSLGYVVGSGALNEAELVSEVCPV